MLGFDVGNLWIQMFDLERVHQYYSLENLLHEISILEFEMTVIIFFRKMNITNNQKSKSYDHNLRFNDNSKI